MRADIEAPAINDFNFLRAFSLWCETAAHEGDGPPVCHGEVVLESCGAPQDRRLILRFRRIGAVRVGSPPGFIDTESFGLVDGAESETGEGAGQHLGDIAEEDALLPTGMRYGFGESSFRSQEGLRLYAQECATVRSERAEEPPRLLAPGLTQRWQISLDSNSWNDGTVPIAQLAGLLEGCVGASSLKEEGTELPKASVPGLLGANRADMDGLRFVRALSLWSESNPDRIRHEPACHGLVTLGAPSGQTVTLCLADVMDLIIRGGHPGVLAVEPFTFWALDSAPGPGRFHKSRFSESGTEAMWGFGDYILRNDGPAFSVGAEGCGVLPAHELGGEDE